MKNKQFHFFVLKDEFAPIMEQFESSFDVVFRQMGRFLSNDQPEYKSFAETGHDGNNPSGFWLTGRSFLVAPRGQALIYQTVHQTDGEVSYHLHQRENPDTIEVTPSGIYPDDPNTLIGGRIATIWDSEMANKMYRQIRSLIRARCKRIDTFWTSPQAIELLSDGWRLTTGVTFPRGVDLRLPIE